MEKKKKLKKKKVGREDIVMDKEPVPVNCYGKAMGLKEAPALLVAGSRTTSRNRSLYSLPLQPLLQLLSTRSRPFSSTTKPSISSSSTIYAIFEPRTN